jgi:hypothetical protein
VIVIDSDLTKQQVARCRNVMRRISIYGKVKFRTIGVVQCFTFDSTGVMSSFIRKYEMDSMTDLVIALGFPLRYHYEE